YHLEFQSQHDPYLSRVTVLYTIVNITQHAIFVSTGGTPTGGLANALAAATKREDGALLITFRRKNHVLESSVTGKTRPSFINLHGVVIQECLPDGKLATSSAITHLKKRHRITEATGLSADADDDKVVVTEPSAKRSEISFISLWTHQLVKKARDYALTYILRTNSPFGAFDDPFSAAKLTLTSQRHAMAPKPRVTCCGQLRASLDRAW
ncbi:hypothetical protein E4U57_008190, partial [Claviceps arundinis]